MSRFHLVETPWGHSLCEVWGVLDVSAPNQASGPRAELVGTWVSPDRMSFHGFRAVLHNPILPKKESSYRPGPPQLYDDWFATNQEADLIVGGVQTVALSLRGITPGRWVGFYRVSQSTEAEHGFIWDQNGIRSFDPALPDIYFPTLLDKNEAWYDPMTHYNGVSAVNATGAVVGFYVTRQVKGKVVTVRQHGYVSVYGTHHSIDYIDPGDGSSARFTNARAINSDGDIVGRFDDQSGATHGYKRNAQDGSFSSPIDYQDSKGWVAARTIAHGIDDAGNIVGEYRDTAGLDHGFIFSDGKFESIDVPAVLKNRSVVSIRPKAISASGKFIVGNYQNAARGVHGFLMEL